MLLIFSGEDDVSYFKKEIVKIYVILHFIGGFLWLLKDVTMKVISFSQQGPRAICILCANGVISNVTLRQPDSSGGTLTYEVWHFVFHFENILL